jgi:hypothetical protein
MRDFIKYCVITLGIKESVIINLRNGKDPNLQTLASYSYGPDGDEIYIRAGKRHIVDIMRSVAHELIHKKQKEQGQLNDNSGKTGSPQENEAIRTFRALQADPSLMATQLAKSAAGAPKIQNIVGTAETELGKVVGKGVGEDLLKSFNLAKQSYDNIPKIDETLALLESGDATTGIGAEVINNVNRLKTFFGSESAKRKVSDTEYLDALLGSDVFPQIGALGIGARGLDTPAEREFLRKVMTGTVAMDKDTLIRLTKTRRNIQERAIKNFNKDVEEGNYDKFFEAAQRPKRKFDIPKPKQIPEGPPAGISQQEWNYMTPEEKALFQ